MSDRKLEQRINNKFYWKTGRSGSETLTLLTLAYGEYAIKKSKCFLISQAVQGSTHVSLALWDNAFVFLWS
jgi:hypothetical protein